MILEKTDGAIYNFSDDGVIVATTKRKAPEDAVRCTVRSALIVDRYPRGIAITEAGIALMDESFSDSFLSVMKCIDAFNKEAYASRNAKIRRNGVDWRKHKSDDSSD
jgi:hypothetical protein